MRSIGRRCGGGTRKRRQRNGRSDARRRIKGRTRDQVLTRKLAVARRKRKKRKIKKRRRVKVKVKIHIDRAREITFKVVATFIALKYIIKIGKIVPTKDKKIK